MENKNSFWKGALAGALLTAFAGLLIVGVSAGLFLFGKRVINNQTGITATVDPTLEASDDIQETTSALQKGDADSKVSIDWKKVDKKMSMIQGIISRYYLFDEDAQKVEDGIYAGLMSGLGDPYSVYYTEEEYDSLMESTGGTYCGIGAMVSQDRTTGIITIAKVFEDSPSFEAGMLPGDIIYKVGEEEVTGMDLDVLVQSYIKGESGTTVKITVIRGENNDEIMLEMKRRQIEVPTVSHQMLPDSVGYVAVTQFDEVTATQFKAAVSDLQSQGMEKLVIDLRDNPGGLLSIVVEMLDYVLPDGMDIENPDLTTKKSKGLLIYTADKNGNGDKYYCRDGHGLNMPIAVLVNGNSASASEVFTGAMKDYKWATIVGTQTFGKGIVQEIMRLGDGTALKITTSHYYTPTGFDLHGEGIAPDVEVELDEELRKKAVVEPEEDNQVQAAVETLK